MVQQSSSPAVQQSSVSKTSSVIGMLQTVLSILEFRQFFLHGALTFLILGNFIHHYLHDNDIDLLDTNLLSFWAVDQDHKSVWWKSVNL